MIGRSQEKADKWDGMILLKLYSKKVNILIIILGNKLTNGVELNDVTKIRADKAIDIMMQSKTDVKVLAMGWKYSDKVKISLAEGIKRYLLRKGISKTNIMTCEQSRDTVGDAFFSRKLYIEGSQIKKAIIVTSKSHIKRCKIIFSHIYKTSQCELEYVSVDDKSYKKEATKEAKSIKIFEDTFLRGSNMTLEEIEKILYEKHKLYLNKQES